MNNFECVKEFNRAFDMVSKEPQSYIGYDEDDYGFIKINPFKNCRQKIFESYSLIRLRLNLINEEIDELNVAIKENDFIETRDAIGDICYVVYGMADVLGIDINSIFTTTLQSEVIKYYVDTTTNTTQTIISSLFIDKIINAYHNNNTEHNNTLRKITNFNYIKIFLNEVINEYTSNTEIKEIKESSHNETHDTVLKTKLLENLTKTYLKLEEECQKEIIYYGDDKQTDSHNYTKFQIVGNLIYELLKLTYCLGSLYNIDVDADFAIIHQSNMSKLCDTEEDAKATVASYELKFKNGNSPYDSPYYYELPELNKWIVKNKSTGKALKNIKYKEVSFGVYNI
jgi:predicted HAD superfamily Cof-like phosphohydrolase